MRANVNAGYQMILHPIQYHGRKLLLRVIGHFQFMFSAILQKCAGRLRQCLRPKLHGDGGFGITRDCRFAHRPVYQLSQ